MLAAVLVLAASAATTLAAPACAALYRFQWPGAGAPNSGFLAVSLSGYNQQTSWINDGERVFA
jgi:hypothetical protein